MRILLFALALHASPALAEPLIDDDPGATCRAAHAAAAPGCPRHVRRRGDRIELITPILFELDKATIRPAGLAVIRDLAIYLNARPDLRLEIQGHNGFDESHRSMRISDRRADSVRAALIKHGVDAARLESQGYGESMPLVMPRTHADRMRNTRIELHIRP